ncbi:GYD domain-containing protein [Trinickia violacea]|uniref:GYD domain-containing protein n=1 Tax=Trinickia violacea TaxID=2571746 RepID=A0A4P8J045_9BURK|nr:GYD domain-containing protein [Trinickia violacea]QCP54087.1 GYD domain-containing protein [Trinickia violacea]
MATYVILSKFTDQGIRAVKNTSQRAAQAAEMAKSFGCELTNVYWTLGDYDVVLTVTAPDDQSLCAFGLAIGSLGNVKTQTLRAFTKDEIGAILAKLP